MCRVPDRHRGRALELRCFRDIGDHDVDFVITDRAQPIALVECQLGDDAVAPGLRYLKACFPDTSAWQISAAGTRNCVNPEGIRVAPAATLLRHLV